MLTQASLIAIVTITAITVIVLTVLIVKSQAELSFNVSKDGVSLAINGKSEQKGDGCLPGEDNSRRFNWNN